MSNQPEEKRIWVFVEDALIILAIGVLWLTICKLEGEIYTWIQLITLVIMVVIFIRRINRIRRRTGDE